KRLATTQPNGLRGAYYVLVRTDPLAPSGDYDLTNNVRAAAVTGQQGSGTPVVITAVPPPDLVVSSLELAAKGDAGQPLRLKWAVRNQGPGPVPGASWYMGCYLSLDPVLDGSDLLMATVVGPEALARLREQDVGARLELGVARQPHVLVPARRERRRRPLVDDRPLDRQRLARVGHR